MFTFIKKLFGLDQETMKAAGVQIEQAPYKVETPVVDLADIAVVQHTPVVEVASVVVAEAPAPVNPQITDAVTQAPDKKQRKPRAVKTEKAATKKAAPVKKAAAIKAARKIK